MSAACCPVCGDPLPPARRYCSKLCYWWRRTARGYSAHEAGYPEPKGNPVAELHREAALEGLAWADVEEAAMELAALEIESLGHEDEIRRAAWGILTGGDPARAFQWATGFARLYGRKASEKDHSAIPKYDTIAQEVGWHFPEFDTEDGTARLWELLLSPRRETRPWLDLHAEAIGRVTAARMPEMAFCDEPF